MRCPDELTLDLWQADALPSEEAAAIAEHVRTCVTCAAVVQGARALGGELRAALALDADEMAYLSRLELASPWRAGPVAAPSWGWIALVGVVGGYLAWLVGGPTFGPLAAEAARIGLGTLPLHIAIGFLFDLGQLFADLARHPALGLSGPVLALCALALLLWPRQMTQQRSTPA